MSTHTVTLSARELELVRRETMKAAAIDLRALADQLEELATLGGWPSHPLLADIHNTTANSQEPMGAIDALGWPTDVADLAARAPAPDVHDGPPNSPWARAPRATRADAPVPDGAA